MPPHQRVPRPCVFCKGGYDAAHTISASIWTSVRVPALPELRAEPAHPLITHASEIKSVGYPRLGSIKISGCRPPEAWGIRLLLGDPEADIAGQLASWGRYHHRTGGGVCRDDGCHVGVGHNFEARGGDAVEGDAGGPGEALAQNLRRLADLPY